MVAMSDLGVILTGVLVGSASGIGGAICGAWMTARSNLPALKLSINAERERARLADKRQVYARYMASLTDVIVAGSKLGDSVDVSPEEHKAMAVALADSEGPMIAAMSEVKLIAPDDLGRLADEVASKVSRAMGALEQDVNSDFVFAPLSERLLKAMRADLGETAPTAVPESTPPKGPAPVTIAPRKPTSTELS
jgi:hypothetical protein